MAREAINYTELLEKEYGERLRKTIDACRKDGLSDEEIYAAFESVGA